MEKTQIQNILKKQKAYFQTGSTKSYDARLKNLLSLRKLIEDNQTEIHKALSKDLGKSEYECYLGETGFLLQEIDHTTKKLKKWMKPKKVPTPLVHFPCRGYIVSEALGSVLIISPWNYPFQLLLSPLVGALAAGNTAILKPSEVAIETSRVIAKLIPSYFDESLVAVVEGGIPETNHLLEENFDHIFYTGNGAVAKIVMEKAATNLTPVTLELGGKSPCFIYGDVDLDLAAKRVVWGKFFNAGQTCVAPDYILIESKRKQQFVGLLKKYILEFYGIDPSKSPDYGRVINSRHFERLAKMLDENKVLIGGDQKSEERYFAPTVVDADPEEPIMQDEIFGPILPIICIDDFESAVEFVKKRDKPLATYAFSKEQRILDKVVSEVSAGGICLNDTIIHLSVDSLPFGGVGPSGMGRYHGQYTFDAFSHQKSVLKRSFWMDLSLRYPPYLGKLDSVKRILSILG